MLLNYLRMALRSLSKNKLYTTINVLGLALGISACLVIFLITHFELSFDKFHPDKERIYRIVVDEQRAGGEHRTFGFSTDPMAMTVRAEVSGLQTVTGFYDYSTNVTIPEGQKIRVKLERPKNGAHSDIVIADPQYFDIFKYQWLAGSPATSISQPFQVVLTESEAHRYFGPGSPDEFIGRQVLYHDSLHTMVSGIVKDWTANTDFGFRDFISVATIQHSFLKNDIDLSSWGMWNYETNAFVKLGNGVTRAQVERQLIGFGKKHLIQEDGDKMTLALQPLSDIHFNAGYEDAFSRKANLPTLYALMGIAVFILLIAAINFINLSTAQSIRRVKEVGIRKVLGGRRGGLILQFLTETFVLTCAAVVISVLLVNPMLRAYRSFIPEGVVFYLTSRDTLLFLASIILITSLLAGFYPARVLSSFLPVISLKGEGGSTFNQRSYLRKSLIVFQFTIALFFIIGTWVIGDQIHYMLSQDMGFTKTAIINISTPWVKDAQMKREVLVNQIRKLPQVAMISGSEGTPAATGHRGTDLTLHKPKGDVKVSAEMHLIDENVLPLYEMRLLAGRNLHQSDTMREVLLNESAARGLGFAHPADAIGQMVESGQKDSKYQTVLPVVGVVADFHSRSFRDTVSPVFLTMNKGANSLLSIKLSMAGRGSEDIHKALTAIAADWKNLYPDVSFEYSFFDETIAAFYDKEQKTAQIMNTAMFIAIFISCLGLFGVTTFMAAQRTREIGIRKVLGASVVGIVKLLSMDFVRLVGLSILIASPIAWYCTHRWLADFAYHVPVHAWIFVLAGLAAMGIALVTVGSRAIGAARANPVKSLRSE
jgi:putative ABC transport system permease protein